MKNQVKEKVGLSEIIGYSCGDLGLGFLMNMLGPYIMLFYTDIFGLAPAIISTMMSIANLISTLSNPAIGTIIDRSHSKWGRCKPFVLVGGFLTAIFCILCFSAPELPVGAKIAYAFICYTGMNIARAVFTNAYGALSANMTQSADLRGNLALYRMIGSSIVGSFVGVIIPKLLNLYSFMGQGKSYTFTMITFAVASGLFFAITAGLPKERYVEEVQEKDDKPVEKVKLKDSFIILFKNKALLLYCIYLFLNTGQGMLTGNTLSYFFKYILKDMNAFALVNSVKSIVMLIGLLVSPILMKKFEKKTIMIISMFGSMVAPIMYCFASEGMGLFIVGANIITSFFTAFSAGLMWGLVADTVEYGELKLGKRTEGINFSMANFCQSAGSTICTFIPGVVMSIAGYTSGEPTLKAIVAIRILNGPLTLIFIGLSIIALFTYPISNKKMKEITEELNRRKNK